MAVVERVILRQMRARLGEPLHGREERIICGDGFNLNVRALREFYSRGRTTEPLTIFPITLMVISYAEFDSKASR